MKKVLTWSLLTLSIVSISCTSQKENKVAQDKFPVTNPIIMDTVYTQEYVADIHAIKNVEVRARVHGEIEKILVDEGKMVRKGQVLFRINDLIYREELTKAKAQLKNAIAEAKAAELDVLNVKILADKNVVSKTEVEMAESKLEALKAKIEEAQSQQTSANTKLSFTQIRAPFDGIIDRIPFKVGSLVDEGTLLTTISDNSEVFVYFNVSENEYLDYVMNDQKSSKENEVSLLLSNLVKHPENGKVETIDGEMNKATGNISFRARFANPKKVLKHGSSGKVQLRNELKNVLIIPQKSVFEVQDKMFVYVIDDKNVVTMRNVTPKVRIPHLYVIEKGLSPTDKILYEGIQIVREGETIVPEFVSLKQIISQLAKQ